MAMGGIGGMPAITPKTTQGGGAALPPYLQMRKPAMAPSYPGQRTQPVVTPKSTAVPGEVSGQIGAPAIQKPLVPQTPQAPYVSPQTKGVAAPATSAQAAGGGSKPTLSDVYGFFKSDLENQRNQALASTRADASARGVFYGTPLTGSEADINTQYLRGLGQLQAGMYGNEQQNELARLGLAESLGWQGGMNMPPMPGGLDWSSLGSLFGTSPAVSGKRSGPSAPTVTPKSGTSSGTDPITGQPLRY